MLVVTPWLLFPVQALASILQKGEECCGLRHHAVCGELQDYCGPACNPIVRGKLMTRSGGFDHGRQ